MRATIAANPIKVALVALALSGAGILTCGCDQKDTPAVMTQADKDVLDAVRAKQQESAQLAARPSMYIRMVGNWDKVDRGIINDYSKATAITFSNASHFDVSNPSGKLTYLDANGRELATVPFTADGQIDAGATKKLSVTAGEVTGDAQRMSVAIEHVTVHGA